MPAWDADCGGGMVKTLIVEDNAVFRQSLANLLCQHFPAMHIAQTGDRDEAWRHVMDTRPDVVFMDIRLPGGSGLDLTRRITRHHRDVVVIVLTSYDLPEYQEAALASGASYYLCKGRTSEQEILSLVSSLVPAQPFP